MKVAFLCLSFVTCSLYISFKEYKLKGMMNIFNVKYPIRNKKS
jgi:hypothetical protein